eukprot:582632-Pelagomonas_calceolata.AAC.1
MLMWLEDCSWILQLPMYLFTTGRVSGDFGQPTFVGYRSNTRPSRRSRPDHVLVSPSLFKCAQKSDICAPILDTTDHG